MRTMSKITFLDLFEFEENHFLYYLHHSTRVEIRHDPSTGKESQHNIYHISFNGAPISMKEKGTKLNGPRALSLLRT